MWSRKDLKEKGKLLIRANYWWMVLISFILMFLEGSGSSNSRAATKFDDSDWSELSTLLNDVSPTLIFATAIAMLGILLIFIVISFVLKVFLLNPLLVGCRRYILNMREGKRNFRDVIFVFSGCYKNVVKIMFLRDLKTSLWTLLFIVPGIIKSYEYYMIPYILTEDPYMDSKRAFELTKSMTDGDKFNIFVLNLSFILWAFASLFTCMLAGIFWVNPYINATFAELYIELREKTLRNGDANRTELTSYSYKGIYTNAY